MKERNPGFTVGRRKVAIIGAGFVGASIAYALTLRNLARKIALIDINKKKAEGEALDIQHGIPYDKVIGYTVTIPEKPGAIGHCEKPEDIVSTGVSLMEQSNE